MCQKQTAVSHSSTESEIISLDTGLRLDGLPALELWDLIVSVLGNISRVSHRSGKPESDVHKRRAKNDNDVDSNTVTESDLSLKSRSFLHRVNDRLRKMLDHLQKMQCNTSTNIL